MNKINNAYLFPLQGPTGQSGLQGPRGPPGDTVRLKLTKKVIKSY